MQNLRNDEIITIKSLSNFPLIKGLNVDRSILHEVTGDCEQWLKSDSKVDDFEFDYEMSLCLMCGCCTEACANYGFDDFSGTPL